MNPYNQSQPVYIKDPTGRLGGGSSVSTPIGPQKSGVFYFPYTPTITNVNSTSYSSYDMTHSNFQQKAFDMSTNSIFSVTAPMIARNSEEAQSVLSGVDFFRGAMKMGFGKNDPLAGLPPVVLHFHAYGIYDKVPVVITDFTWNLDDSIDYIDFKSNNKNVRIPTTSTFVMSLQTTYGATKVRNEFTLQKYASGALRNEGYV
jgi:hypothetical protein